MSRALASHWWRHSDTPNTCGAAPIVSTILGETGPTPREIAGLAWHTRSTQAGDDVRDAVAGSLAQAIDRGVAVAAVTLVAIV